MEARRLLRSVWQPATVGAVCVAWATRCGETAVFDYQRLQRFPQGGTPLQLMKPGYHPHSSAP